MWRWFQKFRNGDESLEHEKVEDGHAVLAMHKWKRLWRKTRVIRCSFYATSVNLFLTGKPLVMKSGLLMITINEQVSDKCPKSQVASAKYYDDCLFASGVVYFSFLEANRSITAEIHCNQLDEMYACLQKTRPALVNRCGTILPHGNARLNVRITLQILIDWMRGAFPTSIFSCSFTY